MSIFDRYIGLPYAEDGRGPIEFDCLGLCRHIFREELGVEVHEELGAYRAPQDRGATGSIKDYAGVEWQKVPPGAERTFDWLLIREQPWHVAIVVEPGWMIHMPADRDSVIERYDTARFELRVEGIYRHPSRIS